MHSSLNESTAFSPAFFFPSFAKKFPKLTKWDEVMKIINGIRTIVIGHINEHQINRPEDGIPRDFMDAYLKEVEGTQDQTSSFHGEAGSKFKCLNSLQRALLMFVIILQSSHYKPSVQTCLLPALTRPLKASRGWFYTCANIPKFRRIYRKNLTRSLGRTV